MNHIPIIMVAGTRSTSGRRTTMQVMSLLLAGKLTIPDLTSRIIIFDLTSHLSIHMCPNIHEAEQLPLLKLLFLVDINQSECRDASDREKNLLGPVAASPGGLPSLNAHVRGAIVGAIGASADPQLARAACGHAGETLAVASPQS